MVSFKARTLSFVCRKKLRRKPCFSSSVYYPYGGDPDHLLSFTRSDLGGGCVGSPGGCVSPGIVNAVLRPILIFFTLPITVLTFGLFLLVSWPDAFAGVLYCKRVPCQRLLGRSAWLDFDQPCELGLSRVCPSKLKPLFSDRQDVSAISLEDVKRAGRRNRHAPAGNGNKTLPLFVPAAANILGHHSLWLQQSLTTAGIVVMTTVIKTCQSPICVSISLCKACTATQFFSLRNNFPFRRFFSFVHALPPL